MVANDLLGRQTKKMSEFDSGKKRGKWGKISVVQRIGNGSQTLQMPGDGKGTGHTGNRMEPTGPSAEQGRTRSMGCLGRESRTRFCHCWKLSKLPSVSSGS